MFRQLAEPTFPEGPFSRIKSNALDGLKQLKDSAAGLAARSHSMVLLNGTRMARREP